MKLYMFGEWIRVNNVQCVRARSREDLKLSAEERKDADTFFDSCFMAGQQVQTIPGERSWGARSLCASRLKESALLSWRGSWKSCFCCRRTGTRRALRMLSTSSSDSRRYRRRARCHLQGWRHHISASRIPAGRQGLCGDKCLLATCPQ